MSTRKKRNSRHWYIPVAFGGAQGNDLRVIVVQDSAKGIQNAAAQFVDVRLAGVAWSASAEYAFACVVALGASERKGNHYSHRQPRWCADTRLAGGKTNEGAVGLDPRA